MIPGQRSLLPSVTMEHNTTSCILIGEEMGTNKYVFTQPIHHKQDMTENQFLSKSKADLN